MSVRGHVDLEHALGEVRVRVTLWEGHDVKLGQPEILHGAVAHEAHTEAKPGDTGEFGSITRAK